MGSFKVTVPGSTVALKDHEQVVKDAPDLGFSELWSSAVERYDAFSPLLVAVNWTCSLQLGIAIVPVFGGGPVTLAMSVSALCDGAPDRVSIGVGSSSTYDCGALELKYQGTGDTVRF